MRNRIAIGLFVLLAGLGVFAFFELFERYEERVDLGWDRAARRNPFLAAERYLSAQGRRVESSGRFEMLDRLPEGGTLLIAQGGDVLSPKRVEALAAWMEKGGHLIAAAPDSKNDPLDPLLSRFSVTSRPMGPRVSLKREGADADTKSNEEDAKEEALPAKKFSEHLRELNRTILEQNEADRAAAADFEKGVPESERSVLSFEDGAAKLTLHFSSGRSLFHPVAAGEAGEAFEGPRPLYWSGDARGLHFMQFEVEGGLLSVVSDAGLWRSENIAHFDHASLLSLLTGDAEQVRIFYGTRMPFVLTLIGRQAPEALVAGGLWLLAWLVYRARRFGPIRRHEIAVRRALAEHLRASAAFLWRAGGPCTLLDSLREEIEKRAARRLPYFAQQEKQGQCESLGRLSGMEVHHIEAAMAAGAPSNREAFLKTVQCLQKIRRSL